MPAEPALALLDATRLFLSRHESALAEGEPARGMEACDGILVALEETLPREIEALGPTRADAIVLRRVAELEGLVRQLKLGFHQLEERNVDVLRFVALLTATRRQLRALHETLRLWAIEHGAAPPTDAPTFDALRAAREALVAGCADAATAALAEAARRGRVEPPAPAGGDLLAAWAALDAIEAAIHRREMGA